MRTPTRLVIGCPVRLRTWCLPAWREALGHALEEAAPRFGPFEVELVFVAGADDSPTLELLNQWGASVLTVNEALHADVRDWDYNGDKNGRLHHMVDLRNLLLSHVRDRSPDFFLSLDSDMVLDRDALYGMLDCYETHKPFGCWAVGGKAMMSSDSSAPSYANWKDPYDHNQGITRVDYLDMMPVAIIMGIKLMDPRAYNVDYQFSRHGEDIGWSEAIAAASGKLWWDGRYSSTHLYRGEEAT